MRLDKVIIALDFSKSKEALKIVDELDELINFYKVGFGLFISEGKKILKELKKREKKIFLDLKFHDIPNTVQNAVRASYNLGVDMLTLHTTGGVEMMKKARDVVEKARVKDNTSLKLLGVTILTSIDGKMFKDIYTSTTSISSVVKNLSLLAKEAGLDGVVASAHEIDIIKKYCGKDFLVVTPGIRLEKLFNEDQKRTVTPREAFDRGADYIVIGRAVTSSKNPRETLLNILK
jgi:orotidine-5'-phosphate decarboxylase